jgi:phosphatidylserine/phosphatidylglycerophosphate/cardiolipin synthase-like enzyme
LLSPKVAVTSAWEGTSLVIHKLLIPLFILVAAVLPRSAAANDILCDPSFEDCRTRLIQLIRNERVGIDVAFWFMEDARYSSELIKRFNAGVPVRVLVDLRANDATPANGTRLQELKDAGIPMRRRTASGILHWKMMLFAGQNTVQFSAANYSPWAFVPVTPYENYTDEVIYFTSQNSVVDSFRTKFDDLWITTSGYTNYANITTDLVRHYGIFTKDPELNFGPSESYRNRAVRRYNAETSAIDVTMYRITDRAHSDAMIKAEQRGVPVRLLTEPEQYRDPKRLWHSWNVDRMYMAGVEIRHRAHAGLLHQKSIVLHSQLLTIFGSSNWSSPSSDSQEEHNYFTYKDNFYQYFDAQFKRKWNNSAGFIESKPFVPLPPDRPAYVDPLHGSLDLPTDAVRLRWYAGNWAHTYDIYFGTLSEPPLLAADQPLGPSEWATDNKQFTVTGLSPGTTYYWRIVSKTAAKIASVGPIYAFRTAGTAPAPDDSSGEIVLHASKASVVQGGWSVVSDTTAAGRAAMHNANAGLGKVNTAAAAPADYFEMTFTAQAGVPYHLWIRGKAEANHYSNDSVHVQFSGSVNATGGAIWRIGSNQSAAVSIEEGSGAGLAGWGWEDNGWGGAGPDVYFSVSGTQTIRIQRREDGISIDQIVLSPLQYLTNRPGATKNDITILMESDGSTIVDDSGGEAEPLPDGERVIYATRATLVGTAWRVIADASAAGGAALENPNAGRAKVNTADAAPASYAEVTVHAEANTAYRLWIRSRAANNHWANDSVHVQFSGSLDPNGAPAWRIGSTDSTVVNLEDCGGCGVSNWGWQDNGYGINILGPVVSFESAGIQTIRLQAREDGIVVDQIVLSPVTYVSSSPGTLKNDATILAEARGGGVSEEPADDPNAGTESDSTSGDETANDTSGDAQDAPTASADEVVLYASTATITGGNWRVIADGSAAAGTAIENPNARAAKIVTAVAEPASYIELTFDAEADRAYRLWIRARAANNHWANDSVHVQFSGSVDPSGTPAWRMGTTDSTIVNLEDCGGCGVSGWGWQDNGYGAQVLGPLVAFEAAGTQTMRIQAREDGVTLDQIVLSAVRFAATAPGPLQDDVTILSDNP